MLAGILAGEPADKTIVFFIGPVFSLKMGSCVKDSAAVKYLKKAGIKRKEEQPIL